MNYIFHPHAERELEDIEAHYDRLGEELGDRFRSEIELALSRISGYPLVGNHFRTGYVGADWIPFLME